MSNISAAIPLIFILIIVAAGFSKCGNVFSLFTEGAKEGIKSAFELLPTLIGIVIATTMFTESGAVDIVKNIFSPISDYFKFPSEIVPLAFLKPISGSAANAQVIDLFRSYGPDSKIGVIASIMGASTETTFYVISVYLSGRKYKTLRYLVPLCLLGDLLTFIFSIISANIFFTS